MVLPHVRPPKDLAWAVAVTTAKTCEECRMIEASLEKCASVCEAVRRAHDASWVVSRALEDLGDIE